MHQTGSDQNISTAMELIAMEFYIDIHGAQMMYPNDFGDPMIVPLVPP